MKGAVLTLLFLVLSFTYALSQTFPIPKQENGKFGYYNESKNTWAIRPKYRFASDFSANGLAMVYEKEWNKCGCIDTSGKTVIPLIYGCNNFFYFGVDTKYIFNSAGLMFAAKPVNQIDYLGGMLNSKGEEVLPFKYNFYHTDFDPLQPYNILSNISKNDKKYCGVVDSTGKIVIPLAYRYLSRLWKDKFYAIDTAGKHGIISTNHSIWVPFDYNVIRMLSPHSLVLIGKDNKYGLINKDKTWVLDLMYDQIISISKNLILAKSGEIITLHNTNGEKINAKNFTGFRQWANMQTKTLLIFKCNDYYGAVDLKGQDALDFKYDTLFVDLQNNLVGSLNEKYGVIDSTGKILADFTYDLINSYKVVNQNNQFGWLNNEYKLTIPCKYEKLQPLTIKSERQKASKTNNKVVLIFKQGNTYGILDVNDSLLCSPIFNQITRVRHNTKNEVYIIGKMNGKYGATSLSGQIKVPFIYDAIASDDASFERFPGGILFIKGKRSYSINWKNYRRKFFRIWDE